MVDILLIFEVHQPYRLRRDFFWGKRAFRRLRKGELFDYYFDREADREIFERASSKCYLPANQILLDLIDEHKSEKRCVEVSFSISGVFLEQCERFGKDVLESFRQLARTGKVEFLSQTYYHSLSSLYPNMEDFAEQVEEHRRALLELFGYRPKVFENTELIYNNGIARSVEDLGFDAICTEGAERILGSNSPNELYQAKGCKELKVLLRNYRLTDDIGFRFSARWWSEWPLTAEKYVNWLASTPGRYVCIFPDYETFGEHHWPETGIHEFLRALPREILKRENLRMATPSEVMAEDETVGTLDVPEPQTISWADVERTTGSWVGNVMQWAYFTSVRDMEKLVKESGDAELVRLWRCFQISDHLYYMFTAGGGPGAVHSYFSPYSNPVDAFIASQSTILDFEERVRMRTFAANEPFKFHKEEGEGGYTSIMACSLTGFYDVLSKAPMESIRFHSAKGDFEAWVRHSLLDADLADKIGELRGSGLDDEKLRSELRRIIHRNLSSRSARLKELGYI